MIVEEVKILRLKTGEEIIGYVSEIDEMKLNIRYPMTVDIMALKDIQSFTISSWLPHQMYKHNDVNLWANDVMFVADATEEFLEYYFKMVDKLEKYILANEVLDNMEEEQELMEALQEKELNVVH
jgi:hypothetical protein